MTINRYKCYICGKEFTQKGHLMNHLKKKKSCQKCPKGFHSQCCYIKTFEGSKRGNGDYILKSIDIDEYQKKYGGRKIFCRNGHELDFCNGEKNRAYFRHKHSNDVGTCEMSEWHIQMQSYFPVTEKYFPQICDSQNRPRKADVFIENSDIIVEIQNSNISRNEVNLRHNDYRKHGMSIVWLVNGNTKDVEVEELQNGGYLITFKNSWKYESFKDENEYILLDWKNNILKVPVRQVKNKMILLKQTINIDDIMKILNKNPNDIWNTWSDEEQHVKPVLRVIQKGAGNGKTHSIWIMILENKDKDTFIVVTKLKSAKTVIKEEIKDLAKRHHVIVDKIEQQKIDNELCWCGEEGYTIQYTHQDTKKKCTVIIATIDSLMYNIGDTSNIINRELFPGILRNIDKNGCTKINSNTGLFRIAGRYIHCNKKTHIMIDESQDLDISYYKAIIRIMCETGIDVTINGDKIQSLDHLDNMLTLSKESISDIHIIIDKPINENRRIKVRHMAEKLNKLIRFGKHNLPEISIPEDLKDTLVDHGPNPIETFDSPTIYANDETEENKQKISKFVDDIIDRVKYEVERHKYKPKDFLFLFPIMKGNSIAGELEARLIQFWSDRYKDEKKYKKYAYVHKHEDGVAIDTSLSEDASRIVTIKTSKGDGRAVVFVLNLTEQALQRLNKNNGIDLVYESYVCVSLTRAKFKTYFGLVPNNDDIYTRFESNNLVAHFPSTSQFIRLEKILENIVPDNLIQKIKDNIDNGESTEKIHKGMPVIEDKVDFNYHCTRRGVMICNAIFHIFKKGNGKSDFYNCQLKVVLDKLTKLSIKSLFPKEYWKYLRELKPMEELKEFPLCNLSHKPIYKKYLDKIIKIINETKAAYKKDNLSLGDLNPINQILLWYSMEVYQLKKYHETTPTHIYNIIDDFEEIEGKHKRFIEVANNIKDIMNNLFSTELLSSEDIQWNCNHHLKHGGNSIDYTIFKSNIEIIGNSDTKVYHFVFVTEINKLSYWDTMLTILMQRWLIRNTSDKGEDLDKFKDKHIVTYLCDLKNISYTVCDWDWDGDKNVKDIIDEEVRQSNIKIFQSYKKEYYKFLQYTKNSGTWKISHKNPYDYIAYKCSYYDHPKCFVDFFKELHIKSKESRESRDAVKNLTNNEHLFSEKLDKNIIDMCNGYFNKKLQDDDDDDYEW